MRPLALAAAAALLAAVAPACMPPAPARTMSSRPGDAAVESRRPSGQSIREVSMRDAATGPSLPANAGTLPAPHRGALPLPAVHVPLDLRALVGLRDKRDPTVAIAALADSLGDTGSMLVFDHTDSDRAGDLTALAIATDHRGVIEFLYLAGGVYRRGFVDLAHPTKHRDASGAILNTFMRTGRRWPPKGTRYLAGELLAHIDRAR